MDLLKEYDKKYKDNNFYHYIIIQTILVYFGVRKGALIELPKKPKDHKNFLKDWSSLLDKLKINRKMDSLGRPSFLHISKKKIPYLKDNKAVGNFLGYQCASNDFYGDEVVKTGKIVFSVYIEKPFLNLAADVCPVTKTKKNFVQILKHYQEFVQKINKVLDPFGYKSIIMIQFWKHKKKQHETWIR